MAQDKIQLRGHHIGTFAIDYWENNFHESKHDRLISKKKKIKKYYKYDESWDKWGELLSQQKDKFVAIYGQEMKDLVDTLYAVLQTRPDLEVEIVEGLDLLCKAGCPRLRPHCTQSSSDGEDVLTLKIYGLEVGRTYTTGDIVQRVRDFTMRTGIRSTRDIKLAQMRRMVALLR